MAKLPNGLEIPDNATVLDWGTRGDSVEFAVWCVPMVAYKGEASVIVQISKKPEGPGLGVILTRSMLQQMLTDVTTRPRC